MATFFVEPYSKYYEKLNGATSMKSDVTSLLNGLSSVASSTNKISSQIESISWQELGSEELSGNLIPVLEKRLDVLKKLISNTLKIACNKAIDELLVKLKEFKKADNDYENNEALLNNLVEPTSVYLPSGDLTDEYNNYIDEKNRINNDKVALEEKINILKQKIDTIVKYIQKIEVDEITEADLVISSSKSNLNLSSIEMKRREFIGNIDTDYYYVSSSAGIKAQELRVFFNGKEYHEGDQIVIKQGETARLTVKLPNTAGRILWLTRTTADGARDGDARVWEQYATAHSEPFVNRYDPSTFLHTNHYDWVVTGLRKGETQISQTTFMKTVNFDEIKSMICLNLKVV